MAVDAIGLTAQKDSSVPKNAAVDQQQFLSILLTQLRFQDPLKPLDNQQFVAQLAQFSSLELSREQTDKIDTLLQINSAGQAIGLLGQQVQVNDAQSDVGTVTAVSFASGQPMLTVTTGSNTPIANVRLGDVTLVRRGS